MAFSQSSWLSRRIKQQSRRIIRAARYFQQCETSLRNGLLKSIPSKATLRTGFANELEKLRNESASQLRGWAISALTLFLTYLFSVFFDTSSIWFFVGLALLLIISVSTINRHYRTGCATALALLAIIIVLPFTATYQISSDHFRFRYRVVDHTSYFEFPGQLTILNRLADSLAPDRLINVKQCDSTNVAVLPLLPYKPLYLSDNVTTPIGYRRFPDLIVDNFTMNIGASVDGPSARALHGSFGIKFGFSSGRRSIRLTYIFPRSYGCQQEHVPLIPALEVLPWNPDDTNSLILAVRTVTNLRKQLFRRSMTLNDARTIIDQHSGNTPDDALLNIVARSLLYQMFDGNVFIQLRSHLGNAVCILMDAHRSTFSNAPFSAFSDSFLRQIVATFGPNSIRAAPACHVSETLITAYKPLPSSPEAIPFDATFKRCLNSKMPMKQCLAKDDKPSPARTCDGLACSTPFPPPLPDEIALEDYDTKYFYPEAATKQDSLIEIASVQPSVCPELRDREESQHFIDWWRTYAYQIVTEPAKCSSTTWKTAFAERQKELHDALACAAKKQIHDPRYDESGPDLFSWLEVKCTGKLNVADVVWRKEVFSFLSNIDSLIDQLRRYSSVMGDSESKALVTALQTFDAIKHDACGAKDVQTCINEYGVWRDYPRLLNLIRDDLHLSLVDPNQKSIIDAFTNLDNVIVDMAICDALQDASLSRLTGYDRATYCVSHGLQEYMAVASTSVGHTVERVGTGPDQGLAYEFETDATGHAIIIKEFPDK